MGNDTIFTGNNNLVEIIINNQYGGLNPVRFGYESCEPSHNYGPAVRTHWLLHYVVSGFGKFIRGGNVYNVSPGEIFVIPPYVETYYEADSQNPWEYMWIGFSTDEEIPEILNNPVISMLGIGEIFESMMKYREYESGRSAYLSSCLWRLWALLIEQKKPAPNHIDKALSLICSEYGNGITVGEIASRLKLDRCYFTSLFTEKVGMSPNKYITKLRLEKAVELMVNYAQKPSVSAISVGYSDIYHFSKAFKKHFGVSPREYVKMYQSKNK